MNFSRRQFIQLSTLSASGICFGFNMLDQEKKLLLNENLYDLSLHLLNDWGNGLLKYQITEDQDQAKYGSLICPSCGIIHGRCGDAIYPLLYLAEKNKDKRFLESALLLYQWMEKNVSDSDGAWLNDPAKGAWKGITVFTAIALGEAVKNYGHILDDKFRNQLLLRLKKAGDFIAQNFNLNFGNINYPVSASYALSLLGQILDDSNFIKKGREFAHSTIQFLTPNDKLIYGEGKPYNKLSQKGCYPVDLGYNIEESLPALTMYSLLTNDEEIKEQVVQSLKAHMEFMLPDGIWDNSWGTRNFKWTGWGSRTSDGCQPAYALLADKDPRFYKVALRNTELLKRCTHDGLLFGGEHLHAHGISPCIHHTFCHSKALATILDHKPEWDVKDENIALPRETVYGIKTFKDIETHLVSKGGFRGTVTAYDREYTMKGGHATGGALSFLWHEKVGTIFTASMGKYQLIEKHNMQSIEDSDAMPLTPRIELISDYLRYSNIYDLSASVKSYEKNDESIFEINSKLVDLEQNLPNCGAVTCAIKYVFSLKKVTINIDCGDLDQLIAPQIILPVISKSGEKYKLSDKIFAVTKEKGIVNISSNKIMAKYPTSKNRIFNFVPGMEAIPIVINSSSATISIEIS